MMADAALVKLLQITDTHCYAQDTQPLEWTTPPVYPNQTLQQVLDHLAAYATSYQALIISGDLAQEETADTYTVLNQRFKQFRLPIHTIAGNHDSSPILQQHLDPQFWQPKRIQYGNWHGLLLNTNRPLRPEGYLTPEQYAWLEQELAQIPEGEHSFIVLHHHAMPIQSAWMDRMGLQQPQVLWDIIERFPSVKLVLNGHIHQEFNGTYTFANGRTVAVHGTPSTCVQLKPLSATMQHDHNRPAWRTLHLYADGTLETRVFYL